MGPFRLVFNVIFVDVISNHKNMMCDINGAVSVLYYNLDVIRVLCDISMRPFRFAFNHLSWGRFGQHHDS